MGDVKLAGVIGLMLGYPAVVPALLAGVILGRLRAAFLLLTKRATRKTAIAYAPYLCLGALAMLNTTRGTATSSRGASGISTKGSSTSWRWPPAARRGGR